MRDLPARVEPGTTVILNDSRVRKARLFAESADGARAEFILLERLDHDHWETLAGPDEEAETRERVPLPRGNVATGTVVEIGEGLPLLRFDLPIDDVWLEKHGHVPLPPYIRRPDSPIDEERYQTTFSRVMGSAAAPTAGLFTSPHSSYRGCATVERASGGSPSTSVWDVPSRTNRRDRRPRHARGGVFRAAGNTGAGLWRPPGGGKVLAVGTTVVRALLIRRYESGLREGDGRTRIYITPGLFVQSGESAFHELSHPSLEPAGLPVSAFAGRELILQSYEEAVRRRIDSLVTVTQYAD